MPRVKFTNLTAGKLGITKPFVGVLAATGDPGGLDSKTIDGITQSELESSAELASLLKAPAKITIDVSEDSNVDDRLEGLATGAVQTEHYQDCQVTGTVVHLRDDDGGAGRAAGSVLAASFSGVQPDQARTHKLVTLAMGAVAGRKVVISGKVRGVATTEEITIAANAETAEGVKPFEGDTSILFPAVPIGGSISVQLSNKLGLAKGISAAADVLKVNKNGADVAVGTVDAVNGTVAQTIGAADDFKITYKK